MSTARDMATLGRRLVYDFPQYYNIFGRTSTSAGIATVQNTNRRVLEAYHGRRRHQDRLHQGGGLQRRLLGAARRPAGDRGGARRQVDRLAQRRGRAADGPRLRQDARDGAASVAPAPLRDVLVAAAAPSKAARRRGSTVAAVAAASARWRSAPAGRPLPRALDGDAIARNSADHRRGDRRGERRADRRAGARATRPAAPPRRPADAAPGRRRPTPRRSASSARPRPSRSPSRRRGRRSRGRRAGRRWRARRRHHRRQRLGRAARRLPRQGRRRAAAPHHRAQGRARAHRRAAPGRGRARCRA